MTLLAFHSIESFSCTSDQYVVPSADVASAWIVTGLGCPARLTHLVFVLVLDPGTGKKLVRHISIENESSITAKGETAFFIVNELVVTQ